jgi:hypothetical protein
VDGRGFIRLRAEQQGRREERARGLQIRFAAQTDLAACGDQPIHFLLHVRALFGVDQRAHLYPFLRRVAHHHFFQAGNQRLAHGVNLALRDDNAADGRTFLPGFGGHLAHHFPDEQGKLRLLRRDVFPSTQQFRESASMVNGMAFATIFGCTRRLCPVLAEPVKVTTSWLSSWSSRSPRRRRSG